MENWYSNSELWLAKSPVIFDKNRLRFTFMEVDKISRLLKLVPGNCVLDACCGIGRHSIALARQGYDVTGIDLTESFIDSAIQSAQTQNVEVKFLKADVKEYRKAGAYDAVLNMFNSFGYFSQDEDNLTVLKNWYMSLADNGKLLIELTSREVAESHIKAHDEFQCDGYHVSADTEILEEARRVVSRWVIEDLKGKKEVEFSHRLYTEEEMKALLASVGFKDVQTYGNLSGSPFLQSSRSLIVTGKK